MVFYNIDFSVTAFAKRIEINKIQKLSRTQGIYIFNLSVSISLLLGETTNNYGCIIRAAVTKKWTSALNRKSHTYNIKHLFLFYPLKREREKCFVEITYFQKEEKKELSSERKRWNWFRAKREKTTLLASSILKIRRNRTPHFKHLHTVPKER